VAGVYLWCLYLADGQHREKAMKRKTTAALIASALLAGSATTAFADAHMRPAAQIAQYEDQIYLVDGNQMTLYVFDNDTPNMSNCYDQCAENWPPLIVDEGMAVDERFTTIERRDGSLQLAYHGHPLYLWKNDRRPGDMTGDGVRGVWHVARP